MEDLKSWKGTPVIPLDENAPLYKGDRIIIRFKWFLGGGGTYLKSAQLAAIDKKLSGRPDFAIRSFVDRGEFLDCEVEVLVSPAAESVGPGSGVTQAGLIATTTVITALAIATVICTVTVCLLKSQYYRLVEKGVIPPTESSFSKISGGFQVLAYVAGGVVVFYILKTLINWK